MKQVIFRLFLLLIIAGLGIKPALACGGCFIVYSVYPTWLLVGLFLLLLELKVALFVGFKRPVSMCIMLCIVPVVMFFGMAFMHALLINYMFQLYGGIIIMIFLLALELPYLENEQQARPALLFLGGMIIVMALPAFLFGKDIFVITHIANNKFQCHAKMKQIANALDSYAKDHKGVYPENLDKIIPTYITVLPKCFNSVKNQWAMAIYKKREGLNTKDYYYEKFSDPEKFVLICQSNFHNRNYHAKYKSPLYDSNNGIEY
ncbi:MAG: hypothetical protein LWY06_20370 [Firmicutes bacterium]|nr:hypothetical protein [Bacillota bacterium]